MKLISVQETLCILHLTCIMKCDFSHINLTVDGIPCIRTSPNLHHVTWHFPEAIPKFREVPVHFTSQGKCVYIWGNAYSMAYAENGIITRASICNKSIQIVLNPYKLLHSSEQVPCTVVIMCVVLVWPFLERAVFSCSQHTLLQLRGG